MSRHVQVTKNKKFAIFLQYLTKEVNDEVNFLHAEDYEGFLQVKSVLWF